MTLTSTPSVPGLRLRQAGSAGAAGECYESAAFDEWLVDRVLRPAKVQGPARLCVRLAYKSMQLGRPADYGGLDPADGEMASSDNVVADNAVHIAPLLPRICSRSRMDCFVS